MSISFRNLDDFSKLMGQVTYPPEPKNRNFRSNESQLPGIIEEDEHCFKKFTEDFKKKLSGGIDKQMAYELINSYAKNQKTKNNIFRYIKDEDEWYNKQQKELEDRKAQKAQKNEEGGTTEKKLSPHVSKTDACVTFTPPAIVPDAAVLVFKTPYRTKFLNIKDVNFEPKWNNGWKADRYNDHDGTIRRVHKNGVINIDMKRREVDVYPPIDNQPEYKLDTLEAIIYFVEGRSENILKQSRAKASSYTTTIMPDSLNSVYTHFDSVDCLPNMNKGWELIEYTKNLSMVASYKNTIVDVDITTRRVLVFPKIDDRRYKIESLEGLFEAVEKIEGKNTTLDYALTGHRVA